MEKQKSMRDLWQSENVGEREREEKKNNGSEAILKVIKPKNFPKLLKYQTKAQVG